MNTHNNAGEAVIDTRTWKELYEQAAVLARQHPGLSCITLQRTLGLGYTKASKLLVELRLFGDYIEASEDSPDADGPSHPDAC